MSRILAFWILEANYLVHKWGLGLHMSAHSNCTRVGFGFFSEAKYRYKNLG